MVPNGWKKTFLSEVSDRVIVGLATSVTDYYVSAGVPIIRNQNIKKGYFDDTEMLYLTPEFSKKHPNKRVKAGDVITVHTGSNVGLTCVVPNEYDGAQTFTTLIVTPNKELLESDFLNHLLNSKYGAYQAMRLVVGGGKGNLNTSDFKNYPILLPPIHEQKNISQILATWDQAITVVSKLLENSQQQKKALVQELLVGKKRLIDGKGGKFCQKWEKKKLSQLFNRVTVKNRGQSNNVVTISAQQGLIRQEDFFKKSVASEVLDDYFLLKKGQFAYNKSYSNGYPMGAIKRLNKYDDGVVTTLYICFEISNQYESYSDFWEHYFESGLLNKGLSQIAHEGGRAHGLLNVKPSDFFSLKLDVPSYVEQQKIASVLSDADREIEIFKQKLRFLKKEKNALMQQLLTGKKRVKVAA